MGANSAKKPTIVGITDVETVIDTAELEEDAASEPVVVRVPRKATQTVGVDEDANDDDDETAIKKSGSRTPILPGPGSQRGLGEGGPLVGTTINPRTQPG